MKTVTFILYYIQIAVVIWCLGALIWSILTGDFATALLDSILLLINIMVTAMADKYEEPRQQMFNFIDKYLK
ncbi:MAG: hypothetical protein U0K68_01660 [Agathobacter sp.]|nr:hypothetical protein [Agathobacter sp.]